MSSQNNAALWGNFVSATGQNEYKNINLNVDLFNRMVVPSCFKQCSRTDIDIVFLNEMECTYKCIITNKQALQHVRALD